MANVQKIAIPGGKTWLRHGGAALARRVAQAGAGIRTACIHGLRPHLRFLTGRLLEIRVKKLLVLMWRMSKADLRLLWFALRRHDRPAWLLPATIGLTLYALAPFNLVLPLLGIVDDMVLVPLVLHYILKLLPLPIVQGFAGGRQDSRFA